MHASLDRTEVIDFGDRNKDIEVVLEPEHACTKYNLSRLYDSDGETGSVKILVVKLYLILKKITNYLKKKNLHSS